MIAIATRAPNIPRRARPWPQLEQALRRPRPRRRSRARSAARPTRARPRPDRQARARPSTRGGLLILLREREELFVAAVAGEVSEGIRDLVGPRLPIDGSFQRPTATGPQRPERAGPPFQIPLRDGARGARPGVCRAVALPRPPVGALGRAGPRAAGRVPRRGPAPAGVLRRQRRDRGGDRADGRVPSPAPAGRGLQGARALGVELHDDALQGRGDPDDLATALQSKAEERPAGSSAPPGETLHSLRTRSTRLRSPDRRRAGALQRLGGGAAALADKLAERISDSDLIEIAAEAVRRRGAPPSSASRRRRRRQAPPRRSRSVS